MPHLFVLTLSPAVLVEADPGYQHHARTPKSLCQILGPGVLGLGFRGLGFR